MAIARTSFEIGIYNSLYVQIIPLRTHACSLQCVVYLRFLSWVVHLESRNSERSTDVNMKQCVLQSIVAWHLTLCSPLKVSLYFGGTYHLYLHGLLAT
jgi:hypothetical protein